MAAAILLLGAVVAAGLGAGRGSAAPSSDAAPAPPVVTPAAPPLIRDGSFEAGGSSWTLEPEVRLVPGEGRGGGSGVRLPGDGAWKNAYTTLTLPSEGCYHLTLWVRGAGDARVDVLTTDWQPLTTLRIGRASAWTHQSVTFTAGRGGDFVLALRDSERGAGVDVDEVRMTPCERE
jgi:hypothetical protein